MKLHLRIEHCYKSVKIPLVEGPDELSNWVVDHKRWSKANTGRGGTSCTFSAATRTDCHHLSSEKVK
jgi:hypothetical protein